MEWIPLQFVVAILKSTAHAYNNVKQPRRHTEPVEIHPTMESTSIGILVIPKRSNSPPLPRTATVRANTYVNMKTKLEAVREMEEKGISVPAMAKKLNVSDNTVRGWKKHAEKLKRWGASRVGRKANIRMKMTRPKNPAVDDAMWAWYQRKRAEGCHLNGTVLMQRAKQFQRELGGPSVGSKGWLQKWQWRYSVRLVAKIGEKTQLESVKGKGDSFEFVNCDDEKLDQQLPSISLASGDESAGQKEATIVTENDDVTDKTEHETVLKTTESRLVPVESAGGSVDEEEESCVDEMIAEEFEPQESKVFLEDYVRSLGSDQWSVGQLVWAPVTDFFYWPCVVVADDAGHHVRTQYFAGRTVTKIHVKYLGRDGGRSWMSKSSLMEVAGSEDIDSMSQTFNSAVEELQQLLRKNTADRGGVGGERVPTQPLQETNPRHFSGGSVSISS